MTLPSGCLGTIRDVTAGAATAVRRPDHARTPHVAQPIGSSAQKLRIRYSRTAATVEASAPPNCDERDGEAPLDHTQAARGDGQVGGELARAVGEEQAPPRDPGPDGEERQGQAGAVEDPVGHSPPHDREHLADGRG